MSKRRWIEVEGDAEDAEAINRLLQAADIVLKGLDASEDVTRVTQEDDE
jgi:hypothetical protein